MAPFQRKHKFPPIRLEETDQALPSDARMKNNTRYIYFKTIAKGGKCVIQTCKDLHLNRIVCYKSLHPELAKDEIEQQRFLREARVTAMLQHPNTVPVYEIGRDTRGSLYFTMKVIHGATLREVLDQLISNDPAAKGHWDLEELIDLLIQVCQALDFAHAHGVVHRDIKPENIVIGPFGEVLLLDWGLAKVSGKPDLATDLEDADPDADLSLTARGPLEATPMYMSPEQVRRAPDLDHRTDVFSLGAVLFEVLTLKPLAWGESLQEVMDNTLNMTPPTPSIVSPDRDIPSLLESLCLRCIAKDPDHRVQSIGRVIKELVYWHRLSVASRPLT